MTTVPTIPHIGGSRHPLSRGLFVRDVLSGKSFEVIEKGLAGEISLLSGNIDPNRGLPVADLFARYKDALVLIEARQRQARDRRGRRPIGDYIHRVRRNTLGSRYLSFATFFSRLIRLGWVERTGEEENSLLGGEAGRDSRLNGPTARRYYRLTQVGLGAGSAWLNPGLFASEAAPLPPAPPTVIPAAPPAVIPPFELADRPGRRGAQQIVVHLRRLEDLGVDTPQVDKDLERLEGELQGWVDQVEEAISREEDKEEPAEDRLDRLQEQQNALEEAVSALGERDVGAVTDALDRAFPARPKDS